MPVALITGVAGQTGSYLAETLRDRGWGIHGLIRDADQVADRPLPGGAIPHIADLATPEDLQSVISEVEPDCVVNLAAISSVAASWREPVQVAQVDGLAVAAMLAAVHELQQRTGKAISFVQASSAEIFGAATIVPQDEDTPIRPVNPYGAAKAYAHHLVGVYRGLDVAASSCILYNHESPRRPETFVTRKITAGVARIEAGLQKTLTLGDLSIRRDWGWAPDYAAAIAAIAASDRPDDYIVATGVSRSIADFVQAAFAAIGVKDWRSFVDIDHSLMRPVDAAELRGDSTRIRERLGWAPTESFDSIVSAMVEHDRSLLQQSR